MSGFEVKEGGEIEVTREGIIAMVAGDFQCRTENYAYVPAGSVLVGVGGNQADIIYRVEMVGNSGDSDSGYQKIKKDQLVRGIKPTSKEGLYDLGALRFIPLLGYFRTIAVSRTLYSRS